MGSKYKLIPHLAEVFGSLQFKTVLDAFSGSGVVAYLLKAMGKTVHANDFLRFSAEVARATVENPGRTLTEADVRALLEPNPARSHFIEDTFDGLYFSRQDNQFLDNVWSNLGRLDDPYKRSLAIASLVLAAAKKQPRGVFTVVGRRYDDGRLDLRLSMQEQFLRAVKMYNRTVMPGAPGNRVTCSDVFDLPDDRYDLVYLDPPYVPPRDDNCYIKRYHFLEGLACYWKDVKILYNTRTKKIEKKWTLFSYKHTIVDALDRLFAKFSRSIIVLSYSSNSIPPREVIMDLLRRYKKTVHVVAVPHRYSFGTHQHVGVGRNEVSEYIFVGM